MDISYIKKVVGYLIHFYRKERDYPVKELLQRDLIYYNNNCKECNKCTNQMTICANGTLYKIENGVPLSNDCFYKQISSKFNKKVSFDRNVYFDLDECSNLLELNIINFSKKNLNSLSAYITRQIAKAKGIMYVEEMYQLYQDIINIELYRQTPNRYNIKKWVYLLPHLSVQDKLFVMYLLFKNGMLTSFDKNDPNSILNIIEPYLNQKLFFELKLIFIPIKEGFNQGLRELLKIDPLSLNVYHRYCLFDQITMCYYNIHDSMLCNEYLLKCTEILDKKPDFGDTKIHRGYSKAGMIFYSNKDYISCANTYLDIFYKNQNSVGINIAFLFRSLELTAQITMLKRVLFDVKMDKIQSQNAKKVIVYYQKKYDKDKISDKDRAELEDYICNYISKFMKDTGYLIRELFDQELLRLVDSTGNHYKYINFNKTKETY